MRYHERTKHHPQKYARSAGFLDWDTEPDPFRRYEGARLKKLPLSDADPEGEYSALWKSGVKAPQSLTLFSISSFLELSLGLSAWKSYGGNSWALRMNPSSGNLHPTESCLILPPLADDLSGGIFHYNPYLHSLEERVSFDNPFWSGVERYFGAGGFLIGLSSVYWREAWKYGERAFRYCCLDIGHAMACLSFSARLQGWKAVSLNALSESDMETIFGFSQTVWAEGEEEHPDLCLFVSGDTEKEIPRGMPGELITAFSRLSFQGMPNRLSKDHVSWAVIDEVASATKKEKTEERSYHYGSREYVKGSYPALKAASIIRQRRSGQAYDGRTGMEREAFLAMMDRTLPRDSCPPFDLEPGEVSVHLLLFVHSVKGLEPGLYVLVRNEKDLDDLKERLHGSFLWERADESLPLYLLEKGDLRNDAAVMSCGQEIAGNGAFSVAMIGKFRERIEKDPHSYRQLHWEAGMIGQILYLEAEAFSFRGTGMGCFFDDLVHQAIGLKDNTYQDLYHFTVGKAVEDKRLSTLPPYYHLKRAAANSQGNSQ
jgi:SagB-type dehydrogenase family enzyme